MIKHRQKYFIIIEIKVQIQCSSSPPSLSLFLSLSLPALLLGLLSLPWEEVSWASSSLSPHKTAGGI